MLFRLLPWLTNNAGLDDDILPIPSGMIANDIVGSIYGNSIKHRIINKNNTPNTQNRTENTTKHGRTLRPKHTDYQAKTNNNNYNRNTQQRRIYFLGSGQQSETEMNPEETVPKQLNT